MVGMVVAYNYQPRHNGANIPLNSYSSLGISDDLIIWRILSSDSKSKMVQLVPHGCLKIQNPAIVVKRVCYKISNVTLERFWLQWATYNYTF